MNDLFGFTWVQLVKVAAVTGAIATGAFGLGDFVADHRTQGARISAAEATISSTESRLATLDERTRGMKDNLGNIQDDLRALRELVESAIRYSRFIPPKDTPHERALRDPKTGN